MRSELDVVGAFLTVSFAECARRDGRTTERGLSGGVCAELSRDFACLLLAQMEDYNSGKKIASR